MKLVKEKTTALGLVIRLYEAETGLYSLKFYMNGFKVDISAYEVNKVFLDELGDFLGKT